MKVKPMIFLTVLLLFIIPFSTFRTFAQGKNKEIRVSLQKRIPSESEAGAFNVVNDIQRWNTNETAIIICDMWDRHWCLGATKRVAEMASVLNNVISIARKEGVLVVHAPSDCIDYYKNYPGRKLALKYICKKATNLICNDKLDSEKDAVWPIDQSDGGCDCSPECKQGNPWTHQIDAIQITENDAISDDGEEIAGLFNNKGIKNVILMGVHTNMCVIGRSFGLRNMSRLGFNVVLMRDLTDTMYDSKQWPKVSHFTGNSLINEYIETYVCPSMVSTDFTGEKQFRFVDDNRPLIAFIIAENEYHANQTLPEFAHELLLNKGVNCDFALGKPVYTGGGIHNIENLQILKDADLSVIFVRRRTLPTDQMNLVKEYAKSGKPILGIRTASHAFSVNKAVTKATGDEIAGSEKESEILEQWPEFDNEVLGGNYQGHYGTLDVATVFTIVPGMENHPLFQGVAPGNFKGPVASLNSLYENRPLKSPNVQVLLLGSVPEKPSEPVLWINKPKKGKVIYTSMGHWEDWKTEQFRKIMFNSVDYLLGN